MLTQFKSFEQQDRADLEYGGQMAACRKVAARDTSFRDHAIEGDWTPDED